MTNKQPAEEILQKVGGKKNINSYSHCSTRLRFDLKDKNSIDKAALERTDGILQVMEVAGQTQVVIGSNVQYVYDELATLLPQGNTSSEKSDGKKSLSCKLSLLFSILVSFFCVPSMRETTDFP